MKDPLAKGFGTPAFREMAGCTEAAFNGSGSWKSGISKSLNRCAGAATHSDLECLMNPK
jgi:hypothetical protein